ERLRQAQPGVGAISDDDHSREPHIDLSRSIVMGMRVEPKRRSRLIDLQYRAPTIAWINQLLRPSVAVARHQEPMPMHRRDRVECIFDRHLDLIAAAHANDRSEHWRRVAVRSRGLPVNERMPPGHDLEVDRIPLPGCIYKLGDWQWGAEQCRIADAISRADERARCERSTTEGKGASGQSHGGSGIGCTISLSCGRSGGGI